MDEKIITMEFPKSSPTDQKQMLELIKCILDLVNKASPDT